MDNYKGIADSDAVKALADQLLDPGGVRPIEPRRKEPSNGKRPTRGIFHDSVIVGLYRASIGTIIAVVAIVGYNKLNGETLAMATLVEDQERLAARCCRSGSLGIPHPK